MDEKRRGEIALLIVKKMISKEGIRVSPGILDDLAEETGVAIDELKEFARTILKELIEEYLGS